MEQHDKAVQGKIFHNYNIVATGISITESRIVLYNLFLNHSPPQLETV